MSEKRGEHFVLVHGGCHGAWCWYKVATQLRSEGHKVTALHSAACGINSKQVQEVQSYTDYFKPLMEFMANLPPDERVILVGHSFGGYGLSLAMEPSLIKFMLLFS
ncbi:Methylesterase [Heracleum sosnowskyi]|uniref:Methylesterase n=1 Tax=Heracleum sosnowskyi TaxID=360622 RepID=A0AAD8HD09_9APIA|nr:Methylesterase [Heracleum sosnowskyi]